MFYILRGDTKTMFRILQPIINTPIKIPFAEILFTMFFTIFIIETGFTFLFLILNKYADTEKKKTLSKRGLDMTFKYAIASFFLYIIFQLPIP